MLHLIIDHAVEFNTPRNMSSPRPHSSKRLGRGILFLWVTAVIEAQAMEDLGMHFIIG